MKALSLLLCIAVGVFMVSCDNKDQKPSPPKISSYPAAHTRLTTDQMASANVVREKVSLPIIDDDWFLYRSTDNQEDWKMRKSDFVTKTVLFDLSGNIVSEDNTYSSGAKYTDLEGEGIEYITLRYNYQDQQLAAYYAGTNTTTKAALVAVSMPSGFTTNFVQVMTSVRIATKGWVHPVK
ncbi:MAG TPA: hypothetical protein VNN22_25575 [Verrucomicrobiae bacterium]|nr:hypothetical protein [Verrucomicrobiae bacterium]